MAFGSLRGGTNVRAAPSSGGSRLSDEVDDVAHRLELLEILVGNPHAEFVLAGDGDVDQRQRVDAEFVTQS